MQAAPTANGNFTSTSPPLATNTGKRQRLTASVTQASTAPSFTVLRAIVG